MQKQRGKVGFFWKTQVKLTRSENKLAKVLSKVPLTSTSADISYLTYLRVIPNRSNSNSWIIWRSGIEGQLNKEFLRVRRKGHCWKKLQKSHKKAILHSLSKLCREHSKVWKFNPRFQSCDGPLNMDVLIYVGWIYRFQLIYPVTIF